MEKLRLHFTFKNTKKLQNISQEEYDCMYNAYIKGYLYKGNITSQSLEESLTDETIKIWLVGK